MIPALRISASRTFVGQHVHREPPHPHVSGTGAEQAGGQPASLPLVRDGDRQVCVGGRSPVPDKPRDARDGDGMLLRQGHERLVIEVVDVGEVGCRKGSE